MKKTSPWAWIPTLYFAEGFPNVDVTALSIVMYMQMGLSDAEVGLYTGWLALPWVIKPLWSPFIDLLKTKMCIRDSSGGDGQQKEWRTPVRLCESAQP